MKYRTRTFYTDSQKALMWERWRQGWTLHQIAQLSARSQPSGSALIECIGPIDGAKFNSLLETKRPTAYFAKDAL